MSTTANASHLLLELLQRGAVLRLVWYYGARHRVRRRNATKGHRENDENGDCARARARARHREKERE